MFDTLKDVSTWLSTSDLVDGNLSAKFWALTRPGRWGCIDWAGRRRDGYGHLNFNGHALLAHRVAWMLRHQQLADPYLTIDHLCCNKACVNADHLEQVTDVENSLRVTRGVPGWIPVGSGRRRQLAATRSLYTATGRRRKSAA